MDDNNTIPSAYEKSNLDRGEVLVQGRSKKKKAALAIIILLIALLVVVVGVFLAVKQFNPEEDAPSDTPSTVEVGEVSGVEKGTVGNDSAWFDELKRKRQKEKEAEARALAREKQRQLEQARAQAEQQKPVVVPTNDVPPPEVPAPTPRVNTTAKRDKNAPPTPHERRLMSGIMVQSGDATSTQSAPSAPPSHDNSYDAPTFAKASATKRASGELDFLLKHGSIIPCALYSQIISDYQGIVMCRVTQDVYSANGKALLVERGSLLTGSQNVELEPGKTRVFTTWADIETPNGISVRIDSLGAGRLGASGNEAWIDNHFKQRFGGAILLSFLDDAFGALANKAASSSNGDITFDSSTENASNMAEKALESTINIAPTGYTQIGQRINIIVARDIDMSSVYRFE
ncbi:hypothetical protein A6E00_13505 [Vibrio diabolicus]|uniref:Inner membrane protein forms channel for type IVsecretion of T-DNA complex (VirB10) n=1 Tax=Vibrio sp. FF_273 TaxID=1652830 RepID=A0A0H4A3N7_9VIBR|nr:type IV secretion system protein VirB10 [Vibrio diabolicus]AKN40884.1 Inner membrane protein forms channel for type IVsecretion of T-DNA complex (VirB10) [Vibrio sp. FF_273]OCH65480.1 hypothetical protein A6E00_13505 [Vibrio diabolicus]